MESSEKSDLNLTSGKEGIEQLLIQKHDEIGQRNIEISTWIDSLINTLDILPTRLKIGLNPLIKSIYPPTNTYSIPEKAENVRENTEIMSLLYSYLTTFLKRDLFPKILSENRFKPSDLDRAICLLTDIKTLVHGVYRFETRSQVVRDPIKKTLVLYPCDTSVGRLLLFFGDYRTLKRFRYISALKEVYDSMKGDGHFESMNQEEKESVVYNSYKLAPDSDFVRTIVRPDIGKSWDELISMFKEDWKELPAPEGRPTSQSKPKPQIK